MAIDVDASLAALAAAVREARPRSFLDLYLERTADTVWDIEGGAVAGRHTLLREGAAARFRGLLRSSDGITRLVLADLLGIAGRRLPPVSLPPFPAPTTLDPLPEVTWRTVRSVRVRVRWAAVIADGQYRQLFRPALCELTLADGRRILATWPPPDATPFPTPVSAAPRSLPDPGPATCLLSPAAAAVLLHEAVGHALEGDHLQAADGYPFAAAGAVFTDPALDIVDDPTRMDLPGAYSADDEGTVAHRTVLVHAGAIAGVLADRETAAHLGVPAGNARRSSIHAWPRPRISNLVVEAPSVPRLPCREGADLEVASVRAGAFEPLSGELRLVVGHAFRLRGGRRVRPLGPFVLVGRVTEVLRSMRVAGPALPSGEPGWCGKAGDIVPVGAVAPWLLVRGLEVR